MRRILIAAATMAFVAGCPAMAQQGPPPNLLEQQQTLQALLNDAIVAIQANQDAQACALRSQALTILNNNFEAFVAVFPANNWSDLQTSLQGSVAQCGAKGY